MSGQDGIFRSDYWQDFQFSNESFALMVFSFQGVLNQVDNAGEGFFLGPVMSGQGQGGSVNLISAP